MRPDLEKVSRILVCPECRGPLAVSRGGLRCEAEDLTFWVGPHGYLDFVVVRPHEGKGTTDEYVDIQHESGAGPLERYVRPWLAEEPFHAVLDVGCGTGRAVSILAEEGYKAYGVDLPNLAAYWIKDRNDPNHFFCADALRLPFPDGTFDAVWSLGVIEHIGTVAGNSLLLQNYRAHRERYASELLRVLKPGGRVLVACPHKHFPIDIQHMPSEPTRPAHPVKEWMWAKAHINVHKTWGRYYLPSYREVERYFGRPAKPLPLKGYFGFSAFKHRALRPFHTFANAYVENLPISLRRTPLNPYMLAEIRK